MPYLKMIQGSDRDIIKDVTLEFFSGDKKFVIGRDATNNLVLSKNIKCSRHHAEIFSKIISSEPQPPQEEYFIRDLKSKNGTFINNKKIQPTPEGEGEKLVHGTIITIGDSSFEFVTTEPADDSVTEEVKQIKSVDENREKIGSETVEIKLDEEEEQKHRADFIGKKITSKYLTYIYEIARIIGSEKSIHPLLDRILKFIANITHSNFGYVILLDKKTDKISFLAIYPKESAIKSPTISKTIAKRVVQYTRPILTSDAMLDGRFSQSDSVADGDIRSVICVPLIKLPSYDGVLYLKNNSTDNPFTEDDLEIVSALAIQIGLAMVSISASDKSKRMLMSMVKVLVSTVEMKDLSIQGHSERVANYASAIAHRLGMTPHEISQVQLAALLHDIGKIASTSTAKEEHIYAGEKLLSQIPEVEEIIPAVKYHHERIDGKGFPYQITSIPLIAKIISAANLLDNLISHGGVKKTGLSIKDALNEIHEESGKEFDPLVVNALLSSFNDGTLFKSTKLFEDSLQ